MKQLLTLFFSIIILVTNGQESPFEFCSFKDQIAFPCWESETIENQIRYWTNGNIRTEYKSLQDSIRTRFEYYESGNLKFTCEVFQAYRTDTTFTEDPDTGDLVMGVCQGYHDVAHGEYKEFKDWHIKSLLSQGQFVNGVMQGEWTVNNKDEGLVVANFNDEGKLEGDYSIYYWTGSYNRDKPKLMGQYSIYDYHYSDIDRDTGERLEFPTRESHRSETWIKYDVGGDTLQLIEYEWKRK